MDRSLPRALSPSLLTRSTSSIIKQVLKLGNDDEGQTVTAQCGASLLELHTWLGKKQLEVGILFYLRGMFCLGGGGGACVARVG